MLFRTRGHQEQLSVLEIRIIHPFKTKWIWFLRKGKKCMKLLFSRLLTYMNKILPQVHYQLHLNWIFRRIKNEKNRLSFQKWVKHIYKMKITHHLHQNKLIIWIKLAIQINIPTMQQFIKFLHLQNQIKQISWKITLIFNI
jgi:hypothetical protein